MSSMNVAMYYNNNDVRIEPMPIPTITDDELLVKVKASGICGSDVMQWYREKTAPRVLGHEIAGDIVKVGKNVESYTVGDRVFISHHVPCNNCRFCTNNQHTLCETLHSTNFYPGGFAEYLKVPKINVKYGTFLLPDDMTYDQAAFIEPLACVVRGLRTAGFKPNQSILVLGSGIAGLLQIKCAKALGAGTIIATDINEYRLELAKRFGADATIHATEDVAKQVKLHNDGLLADLVILCAGVASAVTQAFESVNAGGTVLFFAMTKPGVEIPFHLFDIWKRQITIVSTYAAAPQDITEAMKLIQSKKVEVTDMISHRLALSEAAQGFHLVANAQDSLKVILKP